MSTATDLHLPYVTKYLSRPPLVIDISRMVSDGLSYSYRPGKDWPMVVLGDDRLELTAAAVSGIWLRRIDFDNMMPELPIAPEHAYAHDSAMAAQVRMGHALPLLFQPEILWVSRRDAIRRAELKPYQLVQARKAGLRVPETLVTTDPKAAIAFVEQRGSCIIKPLAPYPPRDHGQPTRILRYDGHLNLEGVRVQAHIFQQLIEPVAELRIAVIGDQVFAAEVRDVAGDAARQEGIRDFRRSFEKDTFEAVAYDLPFEIAEACVAYLRRMELQSGYIDMVVDKRGRYWFLECNPNGQWAFVDDMTVEKIGRALALLLETGQGAL